MKHLGFWATAREEPSRVIIIDDDGVLHTAGEVLRRVNRQANALRSLGLKQGDAVAARLGTRRETLELYMAVLQSGWYFVAIPHVAVLGVPDQWGERVKAAVVVRPGREAEPALVDELKAHCRKHLAALKCPKTFDFVAELPRGDNGKLHKERLRAEYA